MGSERDYTLRVRIGEDDRRRLEMLTMHYGVTMSTVVRMLVKRDADMLQRRLAEWDDCT